MIQKLLQIQVNTKSFIVIERWIPKRDRAAFAKKNKKKNQLARGPQGTAIAGGGLGGTGSANIAGRTVKPAENVPEQLEEVKQPSLAAPKKKNNKKKKKH
jgi:signal recognition particle subunit SRP72